MTGRHQEQRIVDYFRAHPDEIPPFRFRRLLTGRVQCVLCERTGTDRALVGPPDLTQPRWGRYYPWSPWQISCLRDHPWQCSCGRSYPTYNNLWRHIGAERPRGWGRQGDHHVVLTSNYPAQPEQRVSIP